MGRRTYHAARPGTSSLRLDFLAQPVRPDRPSGIPSLRLGFPAGLPAILPRMLDRLLAWAGDDHQEIRRSKLELFRLLILMSAVVELTLTHLFIDTAPGIAKLVVPLALALCLALCLGRGTARAATAAAACCMAGVLLWRLPQTPNHYLLLTTSLLFLALIDLDRPQERELALQALRWQAAIMLFYTGFQKLTWGTYFHAEFLSWRIATDPIFAAPFESLIPATELARLRDLGGGQVGAGPYRSEWLPLVLVSNFVYLFELAIPLFLMVRKTRPAAVAAALLFTGRLWERLALPAVAALYGLLILSRFGILDFYFP